LLEEKGETSASVSLGDLNRDGHLDIVLAKGRHWPLRNRVLLNDGKGQFAASGLDDVPDRTYSAALADLDGDGNLDVVVSNDRPDEKLVYLGDGKGRFRRAGTFGDPGWTTRYVTLADLNGDGFPDIIAANRSGSAQSSKPSFICFNDGKGRFPASVPLPTQSATIIVAADFDGDGAIDLFVPHRDGGQSLVLWNDGKGTFPQSTRVGPAQSEIRAAAAGDVDGDGRIDLVVGDEKAKQVAVLLNTGSRVFHAGEVLASNEVPYSVAIADLNRDGKADVVVGNVKARGSIFFNDGSGRKFNRVPWNDGAGAVYGVAMGDLDGDGWPDLVAARSDAPNAIWFSTVTGPSERAGAKSGEK
jgi:hypothetical protein